MGKVGKGHHAHAPHAGGLAQHRLGIAQVLQGVNLQHHIERLVFKHAQALLQVELNHRHTSLHASQHIGVIYFHAVAGAPTLRLQKAQERPIAAAQVQHPAAARHQTGQGLHHLGIAHRATSCKDICAK